MPRPGYEPEETLDPEDSPAELLGHFDADIQSELLEALNEGRLTEKHLLQIYRLLTTTPEARDPDDVCALAAQAEKMSVEQFTEFVNGQIASWRDQ